MNIYLTTDIFLVLFAQGLPVQTVTGGQGGNAYRGGFNLPLLKKKQTPRSGACCQTPTNPSRN